MITTSCFRKRVANGRTWITITFSMMEVAMKIDSWESGCKRQPAKPTYRLN